jgi:hypothetical protein
MNENESVIGIGYIITKMEKIVIYWIKLIYHIIRNKITLVYHRILKFMISIIITNDKLTLFSKLILMLSVMIKLIKYIIKLKENYSYKNEKNQIKLYSFFNSELSIKSKIKLAIKNKIENKINDLIKISNYKLSKSKNNNSKENIKKPFFILSKYYANYSQLKFKL